MLYQFLCLLNLFSLSFTDKDDLFRPSCSWQKIFVIHSSGIELKSICPSVCKISVNKPYIDTSISLDQSPVCF